MKAGVKSIRLISILLEQNYIAELKRSTEDKEYGDELLVKYGIK